MDPQKPASGGAERSERAQKRGRVAEPEPLAEALAEVAHLKSHLTYLREKIVSSDQELAAALSTSGDRGVSLTNARATLDRIADGFSAGRWPAREDYRLLDVFSTTIRNQLQRFATADKRSAWRNSLNKAAEYSSQEHVECLRSDAAGIVNLLEAILLLGDGAPTLEPREVQRRRCCLVSALDAITKGLRKEWISPMGQLTAWVMQSVTQSELALRILSGLGIGAPIRAPQVAAYKNVGNMLKENSVVCRQNTNLVAYADNCQNGSRKTSRMRADGKSLARYVLLEYELFHKFLVILRTMIVVRI